MARDSSSGPKRGRWVPSWYAVVVVIVYSFLPFVNFLDQNRAEIAQVSTVLLYGVVVSALSLGVVVLISGALRLEIDRAAVGAAVFLLLFFGFGGLNGADSSSATQVPLLAWLLLIGLATWAGARFSGSKRLRTWVAVFGVILVTIPGLAFTVYRATLEGPDRPPSEETVASPFQSRPNVYWFVLDEYGRADQLQAVLGFDNGPFEDDLRNRGFRISETSYTAYPVTALSLASVMDMRYPATTADDVSTGAYVHTDPVRGDSEVVRRFKAEGYRYVYSEAGGLFWSRCDRDFADVCLPTEQVSGRALGELELALLDLTPVGRLDLATASRTDPVQVLDELDARSGLVGEPFFLFAHILSPHEPGRFKDGCVPRATPVTVLDEDQYLLDLTCLNDQLVEAVDRIIEVDPEAIIVLQSDHGSRLKIDRDAPLEEWTDDQLLERYSIFEAIRLPDSCETPTAVHTNRDLFPGIFACLAGEPLPVEPARAFLWTFGDQTDLTEIVDAPWLE